MAVQVSNAEKRQMRRFPSKKIDPVAKSASTTQVEFALAQNTHGICFSDLLKVPLVLSSSPTTFCAKQTGWAFSLPDVDIDVISHHSKDR